HIEKIDLAAEGSVKDAAPATQLGMGGNHTALHRHRFVARGDLKLVAEGQNPVAGAGQGAGALLGKVKVRQIVHLFLDLDQGDIQLRLLGDNLGVIKSAIVQMHAQIGGRQDVVVDRQDEAVRGNQDAGTVGRQPFEAAGAEQLDHLLVDLAGHRIECLLAGQSADDQEQTTKYHGQGNDPTVSHCNL